jgi:hypothetical protein
MGKEGERGGGGDLECRFFDELDACVELTEFVMAPTGVGKYFYAI